MQNMYSLNNILDIVYYGCLQLMVSCRKIINKETCFYADFDEAFYD